ncbi:MAG TPA: hypothetical protein DCZ01_03285 [Elusimicrobia bacterium]|nr:MAG: hypothetical protein A2X37_08115 [Elusimicrobia bacterium GWA2_66_18]OGR72840.1 MAG: hypothetical protein A2X40_07835 [Elusimicrobia bacterium GWC2_65_9]HAZ07554.1 hypothetical protein [Elusimicrobiota bacterium]
MKRSTAGIWMLMCAVEFFAAGLVGAAGPSREESISARDAVALAEKFVKEQGYQDLQPKAVAARPDSGVWFVGFRAAVGDQIRGVMISDNGKKLKRVTQNMKLEWLMAQPEQTTELSSAEARSLAEQFVDASRVKGLAKRAVKMTEHKGDPADYWWAWFERVPKKGVGKASSFAIVSVDKKTRQAKWARK